MQRVFSVCQFPRHCPRRCRPTRLRSQRFAACRNGWIKTGAITVIQVGKTQPRRGRPSLSLPPPPAPPPLPPLSSSAQFVCEQRGGLGALIPHPALPPSLISRRVAVDIKQHHDRSGSSTEAGWVGSPWPGRMQWRRRVGGQQTVGRCWFFRESGVGVSGT